MPKNMMCRQHCRLPHSMQSHRDFSPGIAAQTAIFFCISVFSIISFSAFPACVR